MKYNVVHIPTGYLWHGTPNTYWEYKELVWKEFLRCFQHYIRTDDNFPLYIGFSWDRIGLTFAVLEPLEKGHYTLYNVNNINEFEIIELT